LKNAKCEEEVAEDEPVKKIAMGEKNICEGRKKAPFAGGAGSYEGLGPDKPSRYSNCINASSR
jgi:Txe/YoeB family toxin of Txe-Axe toxin-antitoxin module